MKAAFLKKMPKFKAQPVVLSTRIRLARNLSEQPFPEWARDEQRRVVLSQCSSTISQIANFEQGDLFTMQAIDSLDRKILVEKHLVSKELIAGRKNAAVYVTKDQDCSVMINEEDHLRIQILDNDLNFFSAWKKVNSLDDAIESRLPFAFSSELGYLTACPTNLGTGMRASAMMHLPGLVMANLMEPVIRGMNAMNIVVRGLFGEGSDARGSLFQVSNQMTLGQSEEQILQKMQFVLEKLKEQEINARNKLLSEERSKIIDRITRAYGILRNGHFVASDEAMNLLSLIRLGVDIKIFPETKRKQVDRLFTEVQSAHIQLKMLGEKSQLDRDTFRAEFLRKEFSRFPKPVV